MKPGLRITKQVLEFVKSIAKNDGGQSKKNIDTIKGYNELCNLISGQTCTMTETDKEYLMGLKVQYEETYMNRADGHGEGVPAQAAKNEDAADANGKAAGSDNKKHDASPKNEPNVSDNKKTKASQKSKSNKKPKKSGPSKDGPVHPQQSSTPNVSSTVSTSRNSSNNSGVTVNGNNNTVVISTARAQRSSSASGADTPTETKQKQVSKEEALKKSKESYTEAFRDGERVAYALIGYTTKKEKTDVISTIMSQTPSSIMGFISGFNDNDTVLGIKYGKGGLIDQIDNEYGWTDSEKNICFTKIIENVLSWAKDCQYEDDLNYMLLSDVLDNLKNNSRIDTERTDELINELVSRGKAEARI